MTTNLDTRGALERGLAAEDRFLRVASGHGWEIEKTSTEDDILKHIDFSMKWKPDGPLYTVDVKARNTAEEGEETWIEMRNVNGTAGWLYGEADMIAFEQADRFIVVERDKLRIWIEENVEREYVTLAHQALMKVYTRGGQKDMLTLVKTYHLKGLATGEMMDE